MKRTMLITVVVAALSLGVFQLARRLAHIPSTASTVEGSVMVR
jgi:hypothetical protein